MFHRQRRSEELKWEIVFVKHRFPNIWIFLHNTASPRIYQIWTKIVQQLHRHHGNHTGYVANFQWLNLQSQYTSISNLVKSDIFSTNRSPKQPYCICDIFAMVEFAVPIYLVLKMKFVLENVDGWNGRTQMESRNYMALFNGIRSWWTDGEMTTKSNQNSSFEIGQGLFVSEMWPILACALVNVIIGSVGEGPI